MSVRKCIANLIAAAACFAAIDAAASRIDLTPAVTNTSVGNSFSVAIVLSGLNALTPPLALTDFDLDISYDASLLHASGLTFGSGLGSPPDISGFDLSTAGIVDLFAVSFASYSALHGLQGDTFTLATMTFLALAPGTSSLTFVQNSAFIVDLVNANNQNPVNGADPAHCQTLSCVDVGGARVVIRQSTSVPEPSPLVLLAGAMLALAVVRRASRATLFSR